MNRFQYSLTIDLEEDYRQFAIDQLKEAGYKDINPEKVIYQYFNVMKRRVTSRSRKVFYSKEFVYPEEYKKALQEFEAKVRAGADLTPYMSDKINQAGYDDLLLNDWNIQHFHLTRRFDENGRAKRSDYEIFAYVMNDAFYMIQVYHHKTRDLYWKQEMVRIIRDNWPGLIEKNHIKGITNLGEKLDDHQYREIRNACATTFVELGNGETYGMIGGGYASSGLSLQVVQRADYLHNRLVVFEKIVGENAEWICRTVNQMNESSSFLDVHLLWIIDADHIAMEEKMSRDAKNEKIVSC